jgi:hypothetical protein
MSDSGLNMTNTSKTLVIAVLLADVAFGAYFLYPRDDRSTNDRDAATKSSAAFDAAGSRFGDPHVIAGRVVSAAPPVTSTVDTASAPKQSLAANVATKSGPSASGAEQELRPEAQAPQQLGRTPEPVDGPSSFGSKPRPVPRTGNGRDSLHHRGSNPVAAAMTEEQVKESAKLDPALSPPDLRARDPLYRRGSDPVAAAMTDQLVRESSRLGPALPPPNPPNTK